MPLTSQRFIDEPISVRFEKEPLVAKEPSCPDRFEWGGQEYVILRVLAEWRDHRRRGRMARTMRPQHAERAMRRGSWGVGRFHFQVAVAGGRCFEIYYDRSPGGSGGCKGEWWLRAELSKPNGYGAEAA